MRFDIYTEPPRDTIGAELPLAHLGPHTRTEVRSGCAIPGGQKSLFNENREPPVEGANPNREPTLAGGLRFLRLAPKLWRVRQGLIGHSNGDSNARHFPYGFISPVVGNQIFYQPIRAACDVPTHLLDSKLSN